MGSLITHAGATRGYARLNGLNMYYEIEGTGDPVVYIPPALGQTGMTPFGSLTRGHSVISVDLQGHGRTADIPDRPLSLEQYAEDVVGLLTQLGISKADFLGNSYGGAVAVLIAARYPQFVRRVAAYGATFGPPERAHNLSMLRFDEPPTADAATFAFQRERYKTVAPNPDYWPTFWEKVTRIEWRGFSPDQLGSIEAPVLIMVGDRDFVRVTHAVEAFELIPNAELAVIPDAGHFALFSEPERVIPMVKHFFEKSESRGPVATAGMRYHPGETR
ncbi:MAG TPA: alpha/beta hydrolase [Gemmatimonadaceae bacterium]|jgi:pimeloyl-ACP methyl ester carboxylesterase